MADGSLLEHLASDVAIVRNILLASPEAAVPACPGWSVTDLVGHHGDVQRWATRIVETGQPAAEEHLAPDDLSVLASWYEDGAARLVEVLAITDPAARCWTFDRPPGQAWFWTRRQVLEAAIHRWDAQAAAGDAGDFAHEVAAAGITEVVDDLFPRQVALGRTPPLSASVEIRATDLDRLWTLPSRGSSTDDLAEIAGPAGALLLLLWRRIGLRDAALTVAAPPAVHDELRGCKFAP